MDEETRKEKDKGMDDNKDAIAPQPSPSPVTSFISHFLSSFLLPRVFAACASGERRRKAKEKKANKKERKRLGHLTSPSANDFPRLCSLFFSRHHLAPPSPPHSSLVRAHCRQLIWPTINDTIRSILYELSRIQHRAKLHSPNHVLPLSHRRFLSGTREVYKALKTGLIKAVIAAPNMNDNSDMGLLNEIFFLCHSNNVPLIFGPGRRQLGEYVNFALNMREEEKNNANNKTAATGTAPVTNTATASKSTAPATSSSSPSSTAAPSSAPSAPVKSPSTSSGGGIYKYSSQLVGILDVSPISDLYHRLLHQASCAQQEYRMQQFDSLLRPQGLKEAREEEILRQEWAMKNEERLKQQTAELEEKSIRLALADRARLEAQRIRRAELKKKRIDDAEKEEGNKNNGNDKGKTKK